VVHRPHGDDEDRRPPLTRELVVAGALTVSSDEGVEALTMRTLAARLGVVPAALYRHARNKQQLHDLVLDGVLAEVDRTVHPSLAWTQRIKTLAHRLRAVLEDHPGVAGLLKLRDPLGPHSLAVAEAFLALLHTAGVPDREAGLAFFLVVDYTVGFAVSSPRTSVDERFAAGLDMLIDGLERARGAPRRRALGGRPTTTPRRAAPQHAVDR